MNPILTVTIDGFIYDVVFISDSKNMLLVNRSDGSLKWQSDNSTMRAILPAGLDDGSADRERRDGLSIISDLSNPQIV